MTRACPGEIMHTQAIERFNPWERERDPNRTYYSPDEYYYMSNFSRKRPKFRSNPENLYLDIETKRVALKVSPSVVSLVSYSGEEEIFQGSGTIIESDDNSGVILTSANLIRSTTDQHAIADDIKVVVYLLDGKLYRGQVVAHDLHFNIAAIKIQSDSLLPTANLRHLDDSVTISPSQLHIPEEKSFQLHAHSSSFNLIPGDTVIALGRYSISPHDLMAAPGKFSLDVCGYDCRELFRVTCRITRSGDGGPLVNRHGEVIGFNFYDLFLTPFMPINIAFKWWEHYKKYGELRRPWIGMEMTNLYAASLHILDKVIQKFPRIGKGVIVEEVIPGSSAETAGICPNDVIIECDGKSVQSFLELFEMMWDKVGGSVELVVIRGIEGDPLHLTMVVVEATPDEFYRWPRW
ncbi:hypothetical protein HS088_TW02G00215 [Tripterygium wilfordii]|uniref:PDZ domain-containing protein n=1 Tax=Tripterygium wilfordii TaxID=458696 RepID=A0A7J7DXV3_TRIWF|nr:putative protease Do-like 14 isoform X2 [Tripterygium wilfordii]KAF5751205.1 hypothetical protein HS088_TW02G00215 [Tripterygium wilfordii]